MADVKKKASAGTLESSDVYVEIEPSEAGLVIDLQSVVQAQFGDAIEAAVRDVLRQQGVEQAAVKVLDRGALECVLRARVETALLRSMEDETV